jgi:hypothetical protein
MKATTILGIARRLAWYPFSNLGGRGGAAIYRERYDLHAELVRELASCSALRLPAFLRAAIRKVAIASFANRRGEPYYFRRSAVLELRRAIDVFDRRAW